MLFEWITYIIDAERTFSFVFSIKQNLKTEIQKTPSLDSKGARMARFYTDTTIIAKCSESR